MLRVLDQHPAEMSAMAKNSTQIANFEDVVWSVRVNELWPGSVRIPDASTAAHFAIEGHPEMAMKLTGGEFPMGTHMLTPSLDSVANQKFWSKHLDFSK